MSDVFLSYTRDDQQVAHRFAKALEAHGLSVWWDATIRSGETYDEVTEAALRGARAVVVLWSRKSVTSRWVRSEASVGQRAGRLVPVMIETCERPVMFELIQTVDLAEWSGDTSHPTWLGLVADIRRVMGDGEDGHTPVQLATATELRLPGKPSLAVLPFAQLGGDDGGQLADGVVEEISTVLSRFSSLFVIAGQSSLYYRGSGKTAQQIGRELGVRYLLEGSVRRSGGRVRITAKLVDAVAGEQIWADRFDDTFEDLFELQDRVANAVASTIDSTISDAEMMRAVSRPTSSPDAYELTVRANALLGRYDQPSVTEALKLAEEARALDPTYAWAVAIVGFCHATLALNSWCEDSAASRALALELAAEAMNLAGEDQMALTVTGALLLTAGADVGLAGQLIEHALALNPGKPFILFWAGVLDAETGRFARGLKRQEMAIRLNPRSMYRPFQLQYLGHCLFGLDRYAEAAIVATEVLRLLPKDPRAYVLRAASLALSGRMDAASAAADRLQALGGFEVGRAYFREPAIVARIERAALVLDEARRATLDADSQLTPTVPGGPRDAGEARSVT